MTDETDLESRATKYLSIADVVELSTFSKSTILREIRTGDLDSKYLRRRRLIPVQAYIDWLSEKTGQDDYVQSI